MGRIGFEPLGQFEDLAVFEGFRLRTHDPLRSQQRDIGLIFVRL